MVALNGNSKSSSYFFSLGRKILFVSSILNLFLMKELLVLGNPKTTQRSIQISNESGRRVDVFWVNPDTEELVRQTEPFVYNGGSLPLTSYVGHTFEVRELPSSKTGYCGDPSNEATVGTICRMGTFTVNENDQQSTFSHKVSYVYYFL